MLSLRVFRQCNHRVAHQGNQVDNPRRSLQGNLRGSPLVNPLGNPQVNRADSQADSLADSRQGSQVCNLVANQREYLLANRAVNRL